MRLVLGSVLFGAIVAAVSSCGQQRQSPAPAPLAPVAALAKPVLPAWIISVSPNGRAQSLAQIRVIFAKPVTKVEALSGAGPSDVLSHVSIEPALKGHFVVLTPRMIGFVAEQALPIATRARVTLTAGLRDLDGDTLDHDLAWTFETDPLALRDLPQLRASDDEPTPGPVGLTPTLTVTANAAVDIASLATHATLAGGGDRVPLTATLRAQPTPYPGSDAAELFDPSLNSWTYELRPQRELRKGTAYTLTIDSGVAPAYGNLPTATSFAGGVRTYGPLAIVPQPSSTPSLGLGTRFANGDPSIVFTNPLDPKSVTGAVTVSPAPANVKSLTVVSDDQPNIISIDPYALDTNTTYTLTVAPTVKDTFGQTLGQARSVTWRTSDFSAGAWAPTGTNVIPAGVNVALNFYATNLPGNSYQVAYAKVPPEKMLGGPDPLAFLPVSKSWPAQRLGDAHVNQQSVVRIPLQARLGAPFGALAYGFRTALDGTSSQPSYYGVAQLTNLGVFAQWFPARGIVLVQHMADGAPVAGVHVTVYRMAGYDSTTPPQTCATGTTNAGGEADFYGVDVERCAVSAQQNQAPNLGFVATEGGDVATVTTWSWSGVSRFDVNGGWTSGAPLSRGTIFSDRQMYQPGERGELTGLAYYVSGSRVVADRNVPYRVTLTDPSNHGTSLGTVTTDAYGVFSLPIAFSNQQALGYYTVDAKGANGNDVNGTFRVAEFKPPNFKLTLSLDATSAVAGANIRATASAAYLFGAPLQGGTAHAYVTRDLATVQPKGWDDFWFGPQWFWPEPSPSFDTDVLQRDLPLDAQGAASLDVAVPRDLAFPMTYRVDMETTDVSNLSVADSQSFLALPSDAVIGLASDVVGSAGTPMPVRVIVTDPSGKTISGRTVHLELQKMTYTFATQEVEGGENAQQAIRYDTVATADVTSADAPVTANLTPSDTGPYRVLANFGGAQSVASATEIQVFAFGAGEADWGQSDPNAVAVKLDKKTYAIGDTATALIASPFANADIYVAVVRGDTLYRTIVHNASGAARVNFKVTNDMLPNAAVEAVVVRRSGQNTDTLARTGMAAFDINLADRYLKLAMTPNAPTVTPDGPQSVAFTLTDSKGSPAQGEIVAMVVNDAILQLSGYRLPDLVTTVFADQPIATIFADNRENVLLKTPTPPLEKGFGYGGGYLAGAASTRVRANFLPLAYYGRLKTDASGHASASFTMPDDLTTWRVMAVAVGNDDTQFATNDTTFISTQPLITNPLLPQFARPGDRFDLGVSISNQTGAAGALGLILKLTGALAFDTGTQAQNANEQAATGMQAFRFPVVTGTPASTSFEAASTLGSQRDAFTVPFTVSDRASTDSVIESGATARNGTANIPVALDKGGWLQITLANSIVPQFAVPSDRLLATDALPLADEAASRLIAASALRKLQGPYHLKLTADPAAAVASNLQSLLALQRGDGGFGEFAKASASDPFVSAYALDALLFARAHGAAVNASAITRAAAFMTQVLANPGRFSWCAKDALCKAQLRFEALWALAQNGSRRTDFLADIVAQSNQFDSATQIRLARYLLQTPAWQTQGAAMADHLEQTLYVTGRYAVANLAAPWAWLGSLVQAQAQMLQLLLERHAPVEQLDGAVRALVAQQCNCGWPTSDDTASALIALSAYAATEHLSPTTVTVGAVETNVTPGGVEGPPLATASFSNTASSQTFTLAATSIHGGAIVIRANGAPVHYTLLYTYNVPNDAPGELAAFRVIRTIKSPSAGATTPPLATMDLAPAPPVSVSTGRVFDIGVRIIVDHPVDRLVIEDPLPAGFEAVDTTFRTSLQAVVPQTDSWEIDSRQIYRDRVVAYAQHLGPGVYDLHYLARSVTPGTFIWPGTHAYLRDAPEQFGRSAGTTIQLKQ